MNFKNLSENLIITIVSVLAGGVIGFFSSVYSNKQTIKLLTPTIEEAIRKETTSISNEFKTEIKKLKAKKEAVIRLPINADLKNNVKKSKRFKRKRK